MPYRDLLVPLQPLLGDVDQTLDARYESVGSQQSCDEVVDMM
jgi:hypothetical protein